MNEYDDEDLLKLAINFQKLVQIEKRDIKNNYKEYAREQLVEAMKDDNHDIYQWRRKYVRKNKSGVVPTLTANQGEGGHNVCLIKFEYNFFLIIHVPPNIRTGYKRSLKFRSPRRELLPLIFDTKKGK